MKSQNRISQLTLELYYRGLTTNKERRLVEKALETDSEVRKRYEALQKSDREICQLVTEELNRLEIPEPGSHLEPAASSPRQKKVVAGFILAAAILLCALIPTFLYLKSSDSNNDNVIAEETTHETNTTEETDFTDFADFIEDIPNKEIAVPSEPPAVRRDRGSSSDRIEIAENPRIEHERAAEPELRIEPSSEVTIAIVPVPDTGVQLGGQDQTTDQPAATSVPAEPERPSSPPASGVSIATAPAPDTGVRLRGQSDQVAEQPPPAEPEAPANINIPPGITFIFENMFVNRDLTFVVIPSRITSIGKNAFSGNPLVSVTIGANVSIEDNAIPGNFAAVYNSGGKAAGTYTRPNTDSETWEKN